MRVFIVIGLDFFHILSNYRFESMISALRSSFFSISHQNIGVVRINTMAIDAVIGMMNMRTIDIIPCASISDCRIG